MQNGYLFSQPGWLMNLLARRPFDQATNAHDLGASPPDNGYAATRGSDALILRILDEAASRRPPTGLFDSRDSNLSAGASPPAFLHADSASNPRPGGIDAVIQRLLGDAANKRPQMSLFDPRGSELDAPPAPLERATTAPAAASPAAPQTGYPFDADILETGNAASFLLLPPEQAVALSGYAMGRAGADALFQTPQASSQSQSNAPLPFRGDLSTFDVVERLPGGGASDREAYKHWYEGSGDPLAIEFSDSNIADVEQSIRESAAGGLSGTFQRAINETLSTGLPAYVDTTTRIGTGDIVRGRVNSALRGWLTAQDGQWKFDGVVTGKSERFDFNSDPRRGFPINAGTIYVGTHGHLRGAKDYWANYVGGIKIRARGAIVP